MLPEICRLDVGPVVDGRSCSSAETTALCTLLVRAVRVLSFLLVPEGAPQLADLAGEVYDMPTDGIECMMVYFLLLKF